MVDDLSRFVDAQVDTYASALDELRGGKKRTHWMWFVFPQLRGLGHSAMAQRYGIDRERQDRYGVESQLRAAAAAAAGRFNEEIVPIRVLAGIADKASGQLRSEHVVLSADEGIRADTT